MILPWHKNAFLKLDKMIKQNRLPNAILISGISQIGKFEFSQYLVKAILCKHNVCGKCLLCKLIAKDKPKKPLNNVLIRRSNYQNMIYCKLETDEKGVEAKYIKVDQIRAFCTALNKTADDLRIGILFYADQMNINAANSLLKTLEEPHKKVLLILLAHNKNNLPITILSRCQNIHIAPSYDEETKNWLRNNINTRHTKNFDVAQLIENSYGAPFKAIANIDNFARYKKWQNQLQDIAVNPFKINEIDNFYGNEIEVLKCLQDLVALACRLKTLGQKSELSEFNKLIVKIEPKFLFKLFDDICHAIKLAQTSVNIKLLLDNILIIWSHMTHLKRYVQIIN